MPRGSSPPLPGTLLLALTAVPVSSTALVWCLRNNYTFVALKLAWGEARGRECIPGDTRPTEQRSPRPIAAQPEGRHVFWAEALLLAPHRSTAGYARRSRLASAQNPLPLMYSYFGDTTLAKARVCPRTAFLRNFVENFVGELCRNRPFSTELRQRSTTKLRTSRLGQALYRFELRKFAWSQEAACRKSKPFLFSALSAFFAFFAV